MLDANVIKQQVNAALSEDLGSGDITAQLIPADKEAHARITTREPAIICGQAWVDEVFKQVDPQVKITWQVKDGDQVAPNQILFEVEGKARSLLTAERTALNFLQMLSGTATTVNQWAQKLAGNHTQLLDTRKTIPGHRLAQKYAVRCGGGHNHRIGLYDAFLIKENHIMAAGSITNAINQAKIITPGKKIEVEVENLTQLKEAMNAGADIVMLDNFDVDGIKAAVNLNQKKVKLEVSGNVTQDSISKIAETGVDFISVGSLTKHLHAIDLSMRFIN